MAFGRTCLYHRDFPKGKIFTDEDELNKAVAKGGWKEAPWLVGEPVPQVVEEKVIGDAPVCFPMVDPPKKPRVPGRPSKKFKGGK
jgi:hypothetical protein